MARSTTSGTEVTPYQLFILALCVFVIAVLAIETFLRPGPDVRQLLRYFDDAACAVFLFDFMVSIYRAPRRWRYLFTWGWVDFLSSIPSTGILRLGRAARIVRILRLLRGVRSGRDIAAHLLAHRTSGTFFVAALVSLLVLTLGSIAVLEFEHDVPGANIRSAGDALWWSFVTMTTVGYGDHYPVTTGGRLAAAALMITGVGLFGTFTGYVASWFTASSDTSDP